MSQTVTQEQTSQAQPTNFIGIEQTRIDAAFQRIDDMSIDQMIQRITANPDEGIREGFTIYGCGGIGSNFANMLPNRMIRGTSVVLADPDVIEERNITRQRFSRRHVGGAKVAALKQLFGSDGVRMGNTPSNVAEVEYANGVMQPWDRFRIKTGKALLFTDSMMSRLGLTMTTRHTEYIHAANNSSTSFAIRVNAMNKLELFGYMVYLLVHFIEMEQQATPAASCAEATAEEQTDIANYSAANSAIEIMSNDSPYSLGAIVQRIGFERLTLTKEETSAQMAQLGLQAKSILERAFLQKAQNRLNSFLGTMS